MSQTAELMTFVSSAVRLNRPSAIRLDPSRAFPIQAHVIVRLLIQPFQQHYCRFGRIPDSSELFGENSSVLS